MRSVLIVDDEAHARRVVKLALERAGYEVTLATNGREAMQMLEARKFAAMVTDICMPEMTGRELCEWIREEQPESDMFIWVASSRAEDDSRSWTADLSRVEFLEKPLSLRKLVDTLGKELDGASSP